jgi:hypothetical protein
MLELVIEWIQFIILITGCIEFAKNTTEKKSLCKWSTIQIVSCFVCAIYTVIIKLKETNILTIGISSIFYLLFFVGLSTLFYDLFIKKIKDETKK